MDIMQLNTLKTGPAVLPAGGFFPLKGATPPSLFSPDRGVDPARVASLNLEQAYGGFLSGAPQDSMVSSGKGFYIVNGGGGSGQSFQEFDDFMKEMQRQLEEARRRKGGEAQPPGGPGERGKEKVNLDLAAHGYYEGDKWHPVREIRAWESNNYKNRASRTFNGDWYEPEYGLKWQNVAPQKYYRVKVTWDNGESRTYDVKPDAGGWKTKRYEFYH